MIYFFYSVLNHQSCLLTTIYYNIEIFKYSKNIKDYYRLFNSMEDDFRVFDAVVKESGDSLAITIPKPVCLIL